MSAANKTAMPRRFKLSRLAGYKKPPGAVVVGRPSRWGNPFRPTPMPRLGGNRQWRRDEERRRAQGVVDRFRNALVRGDLGITVGDVRDQLRGKDLLCWCDESAPCHADVLIEVANG